MALRILAQPINGAATQSFIFGAAVSGYPASNVLTARRLEVSRVNAANAGSGLWLTEYKFTWAADVTIGAVAVCRTSLNAAASVTVRAQNSGGGQIGPDLVITSLGGDTALDLFSDDSARSINNFAAWTAGTAPTNVRSITVDLVSTQPMQEVARIMAGQFYQTALNFDWGNAVQWTDPSTAASTYGGDLIATYGGPRRRQITLPFNRIPEADRAYLFDLVRVIGQESDIFISMWPGSGGRLERDHQMWCRLKIVGDITNPSLARYGTSAVFTEC